VHLPGVMPNENRINGIDTVYLQSLRRRGGSVCAQVHAATRDAFCRKSRERGHSV